jgi:hypothetical protein
MLPGGPNLLQVGDRHAPVRGATVDGTGSRTRRQDGGGSPALDDETHAGRGFRSSGARGTRTPDLLGAIQALASPEFGLFAGVSRRSRLGLRPGFSASFRSFTLGSGQRTRSLAQSAIDRPTAGVFTIGSERRTVSRAGTPGHRPERAPGRRRGWLPLAHEKRASRPPIRAREGRSSMAGRCPTRGASGCAAAVRLRPWVNRGARTTTHAPLRRLTRRASAR